MLSWPVWQVNGEFNCGLLRSFSSMFHGKGLPCERDVTAILSWPVWQVNGEFNCGLFRSFSSMFRGKGLPKERDVMAILAWPVWRVNGVFNQELFRSISSMYHRKGLPKEHDVAACMEWLSQTDGIDREALQLMNRLFCGTFAGHKALGLPPVDRLRDYELRLAQLFESTVTDDDQRALEIKQIALFLANRGGSHYLCWPECERFFNVYSGQLHANGSGALAPSTAQALSRLHRVLLAQGGQGIRTFLAVNNEQNWTTSASEREQQLALLSLPVPLELIVGAFDRVPPESWRDYIYFGRKWGTPPDCGQWHEICAWRRVLSQSMSNPRSQRDFIAIAVTLPNDCKKRLMTKAAVEAVITLFPSIRILRTLASYTSPANIATLFCAALDYVQKQQYDAATLTILLPALLQSGLALPRTLQTCLLYTSPSPRDRQKSRMPSSA